MNAINFWTPVRYEGNRNCSEALIEAADNYFCLCGRVAVIDKTNQDQVRFIYHRSSCLGTALKIITYVTIVIPLIVFFSKLFLRCCVFRSPAIYQHPPAVIFGPVNQAPAPVRQAPIPIRPAFAPVPLPPRLNQAPAPVRQAPVPIRPAIAPVRPPLPPAVIFRPFNQAPIPIMQPFAPARFPLPPRVRRGPVNQAPAPVGQVRPWEDLNLNEKIEKKLDLTLRAFEVFKEKRDAQLAEMQENPAWCAVAIEVNEYFLTLIQKLNANENVPIPIYYHASRNNVDDIARENNLRRSMHGAAGPGVYISTRDEHYNNYGDYTYAIDPSAVERFPAVYFNSRVGNRLREEGGLWIAVQSDIPISGENIAHIAVPDQASKDALTQKFWQGNKGRNGGIEFYAPVITRAASDWIRISYTAVDRHPLPAAWHRRHQFDNVPNHVIEQAQPQLQRM